jgi:hypothetical protein
MGGDSTVKEDKRACSLVVYNARRVAEIALMLKLGRQELGDVFEQEFMRVVHPPHVDRAWEWSGLDEEDDRFMKNLTPKKLGEIAEGN